MTVKQYATAVAGCILMMYLATQFPAAWAVGSYLMTSGVLGLYLLKVLR